MIKKFKLAFLILVLAGAVLATGLFLRGHDIAVLSPRGEIASRERRLIITSTLLMLIVVIPVFILTFFIAWRYREGNTKAKYTPDWDHNSKLEFTWWALPMIIISVLAVVAWKSSHDLDPFKPVYASKPPISIQVVALQWKWLFIYPEQNIATINYLQFPSKTPINFEITSDGPMNSFWIPSLGGQIYAMPGMSTQLHLIASGVGQYNGSSANLSGSGFAGMDFVARSSSQADFESWVNSVRRSPSQLTLAQYKQLAQPSENNPVSYYSSTQPGVYDRAVMQFMVPADELPDNSYSLSGAGATQ